MKGIQCRKLDSSDVIIYSSTKLNNKPAVLLSRKPSDSQIHFISATDLNEPIQSNTEKQSEKFSQLKISRQNSASKILSKKKNILSHHKNSKSLINLQQQIIIQQQINNSQIPDQQVILSNQIIKQKQLQYSQNCSPVLSRSPTQLKLKKKKKNNRQHKIKVQSELKSRFLREQHVQNLIEANLHSYKSMKNQQKLQENLERQRVQSLKEIKRILDFQIRLSNYQRFVVHSKSNVSSSKLTTSLPWGIDQQKIKQYWSKLIDIHNKLQQKPIINEDEAMKYYEVKEKLRREKLGVGFLNQLSDQKIKNLRQRKKMENLQISQNNSPNRAKQKKLTQEEETKIKIFMKYKQEYWKQKDLQSKLEYLFQQEKLKQNMQSLQEKIRESKKRVITNSSQRKSSYQLYKNKSGDLISELKSIDNSDINIDKNYELIQSEYNRLFNWRSLQSSQQQNKKQLIKRQGIKKQSKQPEESVNNGSFIKWLQSLPEEYLQEQINQMQSINQQMNNQGFNYILSDEEKFHFLEQYLKEQYQKQKDENKNFLKDDRIIVEENVQSQSKIIQKQEGQMNSIIPVSNEKYDNFVINQEDFDNFDEDYLKNYAAIQIQKVWRGYKTRQVVSEYLQFLLSEQQEEYKQLQQLEKQDQAKEIKESTPEKKKQDQQKKQNVVGIQLKEQSSQKEDNQNYQILQQESIPLKQNNFLISNFDQIDLAKKQDENQIQKYDEIITQINQFKQLKNDLPKDALNFLTDLSKQIEQNKKQITEDSKLESPIRTENDINHQIKQTRKPIVDPERFLDILKQREEQIEEKYQKQMEIMQKMLKQKKVSDNYFLETQEKISKKFQKEKNKIYLSKSEINRIQDLYKDTVKKTLKDQEFMEKIRKYDKSLTNPDDINVSLRQVFSLRTESESDNEGNDKKHYNLILDKSSDLNLNQNKKYNLHSVDVVVPKNSFNQQISSFDNSTKEHHQQEEEHVNYIGGFNEQMPKPHIQDLKTRGSMYAKMLEEHVPPVPAEKQGKNHHVEVFNHKSNPRIAKEKQLEQICEDIFSSLFYDFAFELNQFPQKSLAILMEWDEEVLPNSIASPTGFETTLNYIKDYLIAFSDFIQKNFQQQFLQTLNSPLGISPIDLLKAISLSDLQQSSNAEENNTPLYPLIKHINMLEPAIDEEIWRQFNVFFSPRLKYFTNIDQEVIYLKDAEMFHLRMIYDSFNESLNYLRPYGIRGLPYPWKCNPLKVHANQLSPEKLDHSLGLAITKMLKWGSFLCGFIPEKIETPQGEQIIIEDDYLNQIKEDRLQQMLENEIHENEEKWLNYEEEQTEVLVELSDILFETLLDEATDELYRIQKRKKLYH